MQTEKSNFCHTYAYIFSAHVLKISDRGHSRLGHQGTSSTNLTSEKVQMLVIAIYRLTDLLETFNYNFIRRNSSSEARCWQNECRAFLEPKVVVVKKKTLS